MHKTLAEQIAGRCIHYNGAGNGPTCDAGIRYDDVRDDTVTKGWRLPCFRDSTAKPCPKCEFPTPETVAEQVQAIRAGAPMRLTEPPTLNHREWERYIVYRAMKANDRAESAR